MCMRFKQEEIYNRQQGTGQPHIYISHIKDFPIPVMPIEDQRALFNQFEDRWAKKQELNESINSIRERISSQYNYKVLSAGTETIKE